MEKPGQKQLEFDFIEFMVSGANPEIMAYVSEHFFKLKKEVTRQRKALGFQPYSNQDWIILANELYLAAERNKRPRRNGTDYYTAHLFEGMLEELIRDQSLTGLTSLLTFLKHDDIEDAEDPATLAGDKLFRIGDYENLLDKAHQKKVKKLQEKVRRLVDGVSKFTSGKTAEINREETFKKLLESTRDDGLRIIHSKTADRANNSKTIADGIKPEKQMIFYDETEQVYLPLTRMFKIYKTEEKLLRNLMAFSNPELLKEIDSRINKSRDDFEKKSREKVENALFNAGCPTFGIDPKVEPRPLRTLIDPHKKLSELKLEDVKLVGPLVDYVMITETEKETTDWVKHIINVLTADPKGYETITLGDSRGFLIQIFNAKFGGRIYFRVNDQKSEEHSKRGLLRGLDDRTPEGIKEAINEVLHLQQTTRQSIFKLAEREILKGRNHFFTEKGKRVELPQGSTPLDFALEIHGDLFLGAVRAFVSDDLFFRNRREVNLLDPLPNGSVVEIESALSKQKKSDSSAPQSEPQIHPSWFYFTGSPAHKNLRRYFREHPTEAARHGEAFLKDIETISEIPVETLLKIIAESRPELSNMKNESIFEKVASGEINIPYLLSKRAEAVKVTEWEILVSVPDAPEEGGIFMKKLGEGGVNIDKIETLEPTEEEKGKLSKMSYQVSLRETNPYDFMRLIMKLYYQGYQSIRVKFKGEEEGGFSGFLDRIGLGGLFKS